MRDSSVILPVLAFRAYRMFTEVAQFWSRTEPGAIMIQPLATALQPTARTPLREAAEKLESAFLAEMLKSAGLGQTSSAFGGGIGEEQFASFLVQAQADKLVEAGGIGLVETIVTALGEGRNAG